MDSRASASMSFSAQQERLGEELRALEVQAGISTTDAERAWGGAFIPYGAMGDDDPNLNSEQNNTLYWDNEHDVRFENVRALCFNVPDVRLRRALIAKVCEINDAHDRYLHEDAAAKRQAVDAARLAVNKLPWKGTALLSGACVVIGYWHGGVVDAIAGGVIGAIVASVVISDARRDRKREIATAMEEWSMAENAISEGRLRLRYFTPAEEVTGEQDTDYKSEAFDVRYRSFQTHR